MSQKEQFTVQNKKHWLTPLFSFIKTKDLIPKEWWCFSDGSERTIYYAKKHRLTPPFFIYGS